MVPGWRCPAKCNIWSAGNRCALSGRSAVSKGLARIRRAWVDLEVHAGYRCLRAFCDLGVKPPSHEAAADIIIGMFGS